MNAANPSADFRSLGRILALAAIALALVSPSRLWGQCNPNGPVPTSVSISIAPASIVGGSTTVGTMTITLNNPATGVTQIGINSPGGLLTFTPSLNFGNAVLACGQSSVTYNFTVATVGQPTNATITASGVGSHASASLQVAQNAPTLTLSPSTIIGGSTQTVTGTVTLAAPTLGDGFVAITQNGVVGGIINFNNLTNGGEDLPIAAGHSSATFTLGAQGVTSSTTVNIGASGSGVTSTVGLSVIPNTPTLSLSPGSVTGGSGQTATGTVTLLAPGALSTLVEITQNGHSGGIINFNNLVNYGEDLAIGAGQCCQEEHHMVGNRLYPSYHGYTLDDPVAAELLSLAAGRKLLVQIALNMEDPSGPVPTDAGAVRKPTPLAEISKRTPNLRLLLLGRGNWGGPITASTPNGTGQMTQEIAHAENIYFDISNVESVGGVARFMAATSPARVVFGSHSPFFYFDSALLKVWESSLPEDQTRAVLEGNARGLLKQG